MSVFDLALLNMLEEPQQFPLSELYVDAAESRLADLEARLRNEFSSLNIQALPMRKNDEPKYQLRSLPKRKKATKTEPNWQLLPLPKKPKIKDTVENIGLANRYLTADQLK